MTQPAPHYQPYQPLPPGMGVMAPPKPSGGGLTSLLAGILALVVAGIAVGGSFAPIASLRNSYETDGETTVYGTHVGWWGLSDNGSTSPVEPESMLYGLGLVLVAVLLVLGAVFAFVASRTRGSGPTTGGRSLITGGVALLAGVMLVQSLDVLEEASSYNDRELEAGESLDFSPGLGLVLPLCALGLGLVAVVLAHVGQRQRAFRVEPNTPRMGFPAPYGYQGQGGPGAQQGVPVVAASPAVAAAPATTQNAPSDLEDNSGETTQVVSNATASGTDSTPDSVSTALSTALSGDTPAAAEPPAPVAPPAPVTPPAPVAPTPPAAPAAPEPPATTTSDPAPATPEAQPPAPEPSAPTPPTATPASPAAPSEPTPPAAPSAPSQPEQPSPLSGLPAAPPAPELTDEADENKK